MGKSNLKEKVSTTWNNVVLHWKTPALGKYVSYKEIIAYGVGGMGVQFVMFFCSLIALSATSFLVGNTIGIKPMHLQYMAVASTIIGFGITIGRSYIIDSARFKSGKFRPWLAITGIPTVIIAVVFVWLPYETMSYMQKVIAVFLCYNLLQCFYPFFQQAYTDLANVISPNAHERTDIVSVSSIIYSMAPSLTGLFVPMLSTLTGGLNSITTYRIIHPIVAIVGLLLSYIAYAGTRERIIVAESHVTQFKFSDAFRAVAKNKYFWITSLAGWLGFLEGAVDVIVGWTFIYAYPDRMGLYGVATTLIGNAALWAMLICPIAIRVLGKRNLLIWCNVTNVVLIGLLYPLYNNIPALIILYYLNRFVNSFAIVYTPGINADMRDYQQYFTGERIDGMFGAVGIIGSFIGMFTGMVLPTIYQMLGLEDNYDVLEVASFREDMFDVLIIAAAIGAALNFVPYLFYDLTETKQRGIVKVLKIRAMFEDYGNGILRDESIVEAIDIIDEANLLYKDRTLMTTKDDIKKAERLPARTPEEKEFKKNEIKRLKAAYKEFNTQNRGIKKDRINQAKAMPKSTDAEKAARKAAIKAAKKENRELNKLNADISVCDFIIDEMNKYNTLRIQKQVERSRALEAAGYAGIFNYSKEDMAEAKALPKSTHEEREIRSDAITHARALKNARKAMIKFYGSPENIVEPSDDAFKAAEALPDDTFAHQLEKKRTVKKLVNEKSKYIRSVKPLLDARRQLTEKENYAHLDDIRARYADAKANTDPSMRRAESRSRDSRKSARQTSSAGSRSAWQRRTESEEQTMKKFSKIAAVVALMLVVCLSFTGCGNLGNAIISALSLDVTVDDPALIKVEDILDKTVKTESAKSGDFTYTLYTDNTACITGYTGSNPVVSIPAEIDGTKVIGLENKALKSSSTLKELILPDSVEAIGNYAAMYCDSLEKVTIGKNIKHIGISAFEGSQENAYTGKSKLTTVVFNGAPKTISEKAFYFCSALTEIVLPEGVETIGDWAFAKCFSAKKIIIPEGVTQIDDHAFLKCTGAVEISIPGTVESIAVSTFYRCSSLEKLTIGEGVKKLEKGAFEECKSLKTVVLPESMEELDKYAFYNCTGLDEITIHSGVTVFGGEIFKDVGKLTISTESGSDAEKYAQDNGFDVAVIG